MLLQGEHTVDVRCEVLMLVPVMIMGFQGVMFSRDLSALSISVPSA
jgi:hypothetical protein